MDFTRIINTLVEYMAYPLPGGTISAMQDPSINISVRLAHSGKDESNYPDELSDFVQNKALIPDYNMIEAYLIKNFTLTPTERGYVLYMIKAASDLELEYTVFSKSDIDLSIINYERLVDSMRSSEAPSLRATNNKQRSKARDHLLDRNELKKYSQIVLFFVVLGLGQKYSNVDENEYSGALIMGMLKSISNQMPITTPKTISEYARLENTVFMALDCYFSRGVKIEEYEENSGTMPITRAPA